MNLSIGVIGFFTWACYALIFGFLVRGISSMFPDSTVTKAIGFMY